MSEPIVAARDVHRTFRISAGAFRGTRPLHAVNGVSLQADRGDVLGLVGESGCGKTTFAKMLLGLLPPSSGSIDIAGRPVATLDRLEIARLLQPIFQDPYSSLNPRKSVGAIIGLPLKVQKDPKPDTWRRRIEEMMELVGLPRRLFRNYPSQLSGGQRQRVAIARALINRPQVVICDEPTSALDVSVQSQILNLLLDLRRELNLTYVLISHNLAVVEHIATRVAVMYLGRIVEEASTDAIFERTETPLYAAPCSASVLTPDPSLWHVPETPIWAPPTPTRWNRRLAAPFIRAVHGRDGRIVREQTPHAVAFRKMAGMVECHLYAADKADKIKSRSRKPQSDKKKINRRASSRHERRREPGGRDSPAG